MRMPRSWSSVAWGMSPSLAILGKIRMPHRIVGLHSLQGWLGCWEHLHVRLEQRQSNNLKEAHLRTACISATLGCWKGP